jgi:ADP-dependent NAD(P)H-hydrate dehydratase / NAD(P)H-hydrate epimerase
MKPISSRQQVRELDRILIEEVGIPGACLMEVASRGVARVVCRDHAAAASRGVVVLCGPGNNGGDGYACARWLHHWGVPVRTWSLAGHSKGDAATMREACRHLGIPSVNHVDDAGLVVDAVFGTGLSRPIEGAFAEVLGRVADSGVPVVAIDLPSGLDADTGTVLGTVLPAVATVTLGRLKPGLVAGEGPALAGTVSVVDIGLGLGHAEPPTAEIPELADLAPRWPRRATDAHKTRSGHLLVVAGSRNQAGAAVLACRGALAAGAGLVTLAAPWGAMARLSTLPPEVMVFESGDGDRLAPPPRAALERRTAIVAGPGLGGGVADLGRELADWLRALWRDSTLPLVFDADALPCATGPGAGPRVITPHPGEAGRLLGRSPADVQADRFGAVRDLAADGRTALLKGPWTLVADGDSPVSANPTGNPVLATGGAGDVLAGMVGALLARGVPARDAARLAAWVHGAAADRLRDRRPVGWTAGDVADAVPDVVAELVAACGS